MSEQPEQARADGETVRRRENARAEVVRALGVLERSERNGLEELRQSLCAFIAALRAGSVPRDEAITIVRTLIETPVTPEGRFALLPQAREALLELSMQWCAEEYTR